MYITTCAYLPLFRDLIGVFGCQGQLSQQPVTSAARDVVDSAVSMVETARCLAASPQDAATHQSYSTVSHKLSENIKTLLTAVRLVVSLSFVLTLCHP